MPLGCLQGGGGEFLGDDADVRVGVLEVSGDLRPVRSTCGPISPYIGRDCVKSLRSSYTGSYLQSLRTAEATGHVTHSPSRWAKGRTAGTTARVSGGVGPGVLSRGVRSTEHLATRRALSFLMCSLAGRGMYIPGDSELPEGGMQGNISACRPGRARLTCVPAQVGKGPNSRSNRGSERGSGTGTLALNIKPGTSGFGLFSLLFSQPSA